MSLIRSWFTSLCGLRWHRARGDASRSTPSTCLSIPARRRVCRSVRRRPCPSERSDPLESEQGDLFWKEVRSQTLNADRFRTLLYRQKEQILAEWQAEKHEFHANWDRRSVLKLGKIIESHQEELHCAQAEEFQRRDQQLLHEQLLKQNWDLRKSHYKSHKVTEELKKYQSSTFDTIRRRRLVEERNTILELTGKIQEFKNEINCMNDSIYFQDFRGMSLIRSWFTTQNQKHVSISLCLMLGTPLHAVSGSSLMMVV